MMGALRQMLFVACLLMPFMTIVFQPQFLAFRGMPEGSVQWGIEVSLSIMLTCFCTVLCLATKVTAPLSWTPIGCDATDEEPKPQWSDLSVVRLFKAASSASEDADDDKPDAGGDCELCDAPKPERVYHCHTCGRCIVRMDHHCFLFNCCIGIANHRYFLCWLMVVTTLGMFSTASSYPVFAICGLRGMAEGTRSLTDAEVEKCLRIGPLLTIAACPFSAGVALSAACMFVLHLTLILVGRTTHELFVYTLIPWASRRPSHAVPLGQSPAGGERGWFGDLGDVWVPELSPLAKLCGAGTGMGGGGGGQGVGSEGKKRK